MCFFSTLEFAAFVGRTVCSLVFSEENATAALILEVNVRPAKEAGKGQVDIDGR